MGGSGGADDVGADEWFRCLLDVVLDLVEVREACPRAGRGRKVFARHWARDWRALARHNSFSRSKHVRATSLKKKERALDACLANATPTRRLGERGGAARQEHDNPPADDAEGRRQLGRQGDQVYRPRAEERQSARRHHPCSRQVGEGGGVSFGFGYGGVGRVLHPPRLEGAQGRLNLGARLLLPPKGLGRREDGSAQVGDRVG